MMLSISTTSVPATDLGYLLAKHPDRIQEFDLSFGKAHTFYTDAQNDFCQAVLLLDVNPVSLIRLKRWDGMEGELTAYVNDRPYVASSFMSVAIARVWGSALNGHCKAKPDLAESTIPLKAEISVLPCHGDRDFIKKLFEPLGYEVKIEQDAHPYYRVSLSYEGKLSQLLAHLYVLLPVLDDDKHYWVDQNEIEKLLAKGASWLHEHPLAPEITRRYLKKQTGLVQIALNRLGQKVGSRSQPTLDEVRLETVARLVETTQASSCLDLGCGDGKLLRLLVKNPRLTRIAGVDCSLKAIDRARKRLNFMQLSPLERLRLDIFQGSVLYRDKRFQNFDIVSMIEVIEHLDLERLPAMEHVLFEQAKPRYIIITTPDASYNENFSFIQPGAMRHPDHRFEWNRTQFQTWATSVARTYGYDLDFMGIGPCDSGLRSPTQLAFFTKNEDAAE